MWFQFAVRRSLRVGSEAFGTSGLRRLFRPGLNASSAAIQAMFGPLGQESLNCGSTMALVTGSIQQRGSMLVILLAGGDKSTQAKDIKSAQDLALNFKEDE